MDDYRIWVSYHKDELVAAYGLHDDGNHRLFATHHEPDGENINSLNPLYSEMVTMYYVWKNGLRTKYVGFEHYRRHLHVVHPLPKEGECQVFRCLDFGILTVYQQYAKHHNSKDMDTALGLLEGRYGKDNPYARHILDGHLLISNCMFLMQWKDFTRLCRFLFPILEEFCNACGCGTDSEKWREKALRDFGEKRTEYQMRTVSFIAERLISAWIATHMRWHVGIDVAIVNYNTPELTMAAIRSLQKRSPGCRVTVFDNSDRQPFAQTDGVAVIDNTKGKVIDFEKLLEQWPDREYDDRNKSNFGSAKHTASVDKLFNLLPDGFLLMDSDVLVRSDVRKLADRDMAAVGMEQTKDGVALLQPFLCWLNVPMLKEHGVGYFDGGHMWALTPGNRWDTGSWLLHQLKEKKLPWRSEDIWPHIVHLGHGSWKGKKAGQWLEENKALWE